jgi:hypothetical protein
MDGPTLSNALLIIIAVGMAVVIVLWTVILMYVARIVRELEAAVRRAKDLLHIFKPKKSRHGTQKPS